MQLALGRGLCHGADDEASRQPLGKELLQSVAQVFALGLVLDALRDADMRILRQIDEQPPGKTDLRGEPRSLGADRVLDHLHQQRLALVQDALDRAVFVTMAVLAMFPDVGDVQKRRALEPDFDKSRLHPGEHARDAADVDVADEPPRR